MRRPRLALAVLAALAVLTSACSSSSSDEPGPYPPGRAAGEARQPDGGMRAARADDLLHDALAVLTGAPWWSDGGIVKAVGLTPDQTAALDKAYAPQGDEIAKLQRDSAVVQRELRELVDSEKPATDDILAAAARVRALRDSLFDRQMRLLTDERAILSQPQWQTLQQKLLARDRDDSGNRYDRRGRMGGRGGMGGMGGGRRPGWGG